MPHLFIFTARQGCWRGRTAQESLWARGVSILAISAEGHWNLFYSVISVMATRFCYQPRGDFQKEHLEMEINKSNEHTLGHHRAASIFPGSYMKKAPSLWMCCTKDQNPPTAQVSPRYAERAKKEWEKNCQDENIFLNNQVQDVKIKFEAQIA